MKERRMIGGDLCERVESFADVKLFDIMRIPGCIRCGQVHRVCVAKEGPAFIPSGFSWICEPSPSCVVGELLLVESDVTHPLGVWRVVEDANDRALAARTRNRKAALVREVGEILERSRP